MFEINDGMITTKSSASNFLKLINKTKKYYNSKTFLKLYNKIYKKYKNFLEITIII